MEDKKERFGVKEWDWKDIKLHSKFQSLEHNGTGSKVHRKLSVKVASVFWGRKDSTERSRTLNENSGNGWKG
jgi:hypothetical protein